MKFLSIVTIILFSFSASVFGHMAMKTDTLPDNAYTVKVGEMVWTISVKFHGSGLYWGWIVATNPHLFPKGLSDPRVHMDTIHHMIIVDIFPGDILYIVSKEEILARMNMTEEEFLSQSPYDLDCSSYIEYMEQNPPPAHPLAEPELPVAETPAPDTAHTPACNDTVIANENAAALLLGLKDTSLETDSAVTLSTPPVIVDKGNEGEIKEPTPQPHGGQPKIPTNKKFVGSVEFWWMTGISAFLLVTGIVAFVLKRKNQRKKFWVNGPRTEDNEKEIPRTYFQLSKNPIFDGTLDPDKVEVVFRAAQKNADIWKNKDFSKVRKDDTITIQAIFFVKTKAMPWIKGVAFNNTGHELGSIPLKDLKGFLVNVVIENENKGLISGTYFFTQMYGALVNIASKVEYDEPMQEVYRIKPEEARLAKSA